jgi:benzodiazapine receptor
MQVIGATPRTGADGVRQIMVVLAVIGTIAVNALANLLPINGRNTGAVSDGFPVYIIPAGYAFSIWGLIYLGLIAYAIYQALPQQAGNPALRATGWLFVASCVANAAWLFLWHYEQFALTMVAMLALLALLITIYVRLGVGKAEVSPAMRFLVHVPFSIYLGWITVATILNASVVLYDLGWSGWGLSDEAWGAVMIIAGLAIALMVALSRRDFVYMGVIVWAFAAIFVKHSAAPLVGVTAGVSTAVAALAVIAIIFLSMRRERVSVT